MPSFGDMLEVVDLFQVQAIECDEIKCVAVRNRNSKCSKCVDACIADAITVSHNEVDIDAGACVNCGCCVAICPTSALFAVNPTAAETTQRVAKTCDRVTGLAVIACERKASKREGDPERYASVPCLGHLTEEALLNLAAAGLDDIVLIDGDCATCKYGASSPHVDAVISEAVKLLDAGGSQAIITRSSEFPPEVIDHAKSNIRGKSRRGIMRQTGSYVKTVAGNVVSKTIEEQLGKDKEPLKLRDRLHAGKSGRIPPFEPKHNYALLDDIMKLREIADEVEFADTTKFADKTNETETADKAYRASDVLDGRHFGDVEIDPVKCSGCGMCVLFCPTQALKYAKYDEPEDPALRYLEFQESECTQCMLCKDICLRDCLEVHSKVSVESLLDFEPKLIEIARPQNRTSLIDLAKRNKK